MKGMNLIVIYIAVVEFSSSNGFFKNKYNATSESTANNRLRNVSSNPFRGGSSNKVKARLLTKLHTTRQSRNSKVCFCIEQVCKRTKHFWSRLCKKFT